MPLFTFEKRFETGFPAIDAQHSHLISLINKLDLAVQQQTGELDIDDLLQELVRYVGTHFEEEEALMMRHDFPDLPSHHQEHDYYVTRLSQIQESVQDNEALGRNILEFLMSWIINHIQGVDMKYAAFIRGDLVYNKE